MSIDQFDYQKAFSRNLGWVTPVEQKIISQTRVGIIGMGGVGGQYAEVLARLGVTKFSICDQDEFSVENTNRQNACQVENYGRPKVEVIRERILSINPKAEVKVRNRFLQAADIPAFCDEIDFYFDSLDFFVLDIREELFAQLRARGKTAISSAPIGTGSSAIVFDSTSMSFRDYFGLHSTQVETHRNVLFLIGIAPSLQHTKYLVDRSYSNFNSRKAPSLPLGVYSCAATAGTIFLKCVLGRGKVLKAPWTLHYDPYLMTVKKSYAWWGYKNPLQKIRFHIVKSFLGL